MDLSGLTAKLDVFTGVHQLFLMLALVLIFLYGLSVGKTRAMLSLLSLYIAYVLTTTFPFIGALQGLVSGLANQGFVPVGLFFLLYFAVSFTLGYSALKHRLSLGELSFGRVLAISVFQVGLLASMLVSLLPRELLPDSLAAVYPYLGSQVALFLWAAASLAILPFMKQGVHSRE